MTFIFTPQRVAELRKRRDQTHAVLVLPSTPVTTGRLRDWYREYTTHDADGVESGTKREQMADTGITIVRVQMVDTYAERPYGDFLVFDQDVAKACGFKNTVELRADWRQRHPRSELAKLVWFALGDWRDKDRFLRRYISRGGDYTHGRQDDVIDELPALTEEQLQELAANAHQRDLARTAQAEQQAQTETLAQRVARLESVGDSLVREIRNEMRIIADRAQRARRKLGR